MLQSPAGVWTQCTHTFSQVFLHFWNAVEAREESPSVIFTMRPFNYPLLFMHSMSVLEIRKSSLSLYPRVSLCVLNETPEDWGSVSAEGYAF